MRVTSRNGVTIQGVALFTLWADERLQDGRILVTP